MITKLVNVRGLDQTSEAFRQKLVAVAYANELNPDYLAAVISLETAGTFSPSIKNPKSSATGLIQIKEEYAKKLGTSTEALARMTAEEQLDWVAKWYKEVLGGRRITTLTDHYLAVFSPAFIGHPENAVAYKSPSEFYERNKGFDHDKNGIIRVGEIASSIHSVYQAGMNRGVIEVSDVSAPAKKASGGFVAFFLAAMGVAVWLTNTSNSR